MTHSSHTSKQSHAVDPYGNEVTIVQRIPINGTVVNQYFYETFCSSELVYEYDDFFGTSYRRAETPESTQCKGIDVFVSFSTFSTSLTLSLLFHSFVIL